MKLNANSVKIDNTMNACAIKIFQTLSLCFQLAGSLCLAKVIHSFEVIKKQMKREAKVNSGGVPALKSKDFSDALGASEAKDARWLKLGVTSILIGYVLQIFITW